jgi:hypothetical protein
LSEDKRRRTANREAERERGIAWRALNPEAQAARAAQWRRDNPLKRRAYQRNYDLRRKFGINSADYALLFEAQSGVCAICKQEETATWRGRALQLAVDHDHQTGKVRGLLCGRCNPQLEAVERPGWLEKALAYLAKYKEKK